MDLNRSSRAAADRRGVRRLSALLTALALVTGTALTTAATAVDDTTGTTNAVSTQAASSDAASAGESGSSDGTDAASAGKNSAGAEQPAGRTGTDQSAAATGADTKSSDPAASQDDADSGAEKNSADAGTDKGSTDSDAGKSTGDSGADKDAADTGAGGSTEPSQQEEPPSGTNGRSGDDDASNTDQGATQAPSGDEGDDAGQPADAPGANADRPAEQKSKDASERKIDGVDALSIPSPTSTTAVINVSVGGARTGSGDVADLAGVTLGLYSNSNGQPGAALTDSWATCVSDADGDCSFTIPDAQEGTDDGYVCVERWMGICLDWEWVEGTPDGANYRDRYWVKAVSAPAGWYLNPALQTDAGVTDYAFRTPRVEAGETYQSGDDFMDGGNGSSTSGGVWQLSNINPDLRVTCSAGLDVALILDLSGSVANAGAVDDLQEAAKGMVDALAGTGSSMALYTFAADAPRDNGSNKNYSAMEIDQGSNAATIKSRIDAYSAGGGTNWDEGLFQVAQAGAGYDLAIVITDGLPTYYRSGGSGQNTRFIEDENAVFSANAIKAQGTRLIAVGVGDGISGSAVNLRAVSGTTAYAAGSQASQADYFQADWGELAGLLAEVARGATCQATIEVTKHTVPYGGTEGNGGAGWTFETTATNGTLDPASTQTTGASGTVSWTLGFDSPTPAPADVDITEQLTSAQSGQGWALESVACTVNGDDAGDGTDLSVTSGDEVKCTVVNTQHLVPGIDIEKRAWNVTSAEDLDGADEIGAGDDVVSGTVITWTYVVTNTGQTTLNDIAVTDDQGVAVTCPETSLEPNESMTCTGSGPVTAH